MIAYCILNTANGKRYIGITSMTLASRWSSHMWSVKNGSQYLLHRAMRKHGVESFVVEEVARLLPGSDYAELCELERHLIAREGTKRPHGYNMTDGGEGTVGVERSDEYRAKQRTLKAAYWTGEKRAEQAERVRGTKRSEETKRKRKSYWTPEVRAAKAAKMTGKTLPAEHVENMRKATKGRVAHENTVAAVRAAWADPEHREARVVKMKAAWTPDQRAAAAKRMSAIGKAWQTKRRDARKAG